MKTCPKCKQEKTDFEFNKNNTKKDGLSSVCKECNKLYLKDHYLRNKEYYLLKGTKHKKKLKLWFKEYKSNLVCAQCGENNPACLDFHHEDPNEKEIEVSKLANIGMSKSRIIEEIQKCTILCANCHRKLHYDS